MYEFGSGHTDSTLPGCQQLLVPSAPPPAPTLEHLVLLLCQMLPLTDAFAARDGRTLLAPTAALVQLAGTEDDLEDSDLGATLLVMEGNRTLALT